MFFKNLLILFTLCIVAFGLQAQDETDPTHEHAHLYELSFKKDGAYLSAGIGLSILGTILLNNVDEPSLDEINALDPMDIPGFDRGAIHNYSSTAQTISDIILFTGATLPFVTYLSESCRGQAAAIGIMALETFLISNSLTNITKATVKRYRPFNYNPEVPERIKLGSRSRFSFFSGHASNTAAMSFFSAKVFTDLHPDMKNKYLIWATAAAIPAAISYLRYEAGKHFPTDLIVGYGLGAAVGLLIPSLHLNENVNLGITENSGLGLKINLK